MTGLPYFGMPYVPTTVELPRRDPFEAKCELIKEAQRMIKLIEQDRVTSASIAFRQGGKSIKSRAG